ncbi:MAG: hypothetical protein FD169_156 [Bacillota bacterium]|nr:MAG: hypothetical protein FD169_156 [Bacillota bacterium]
MPQGVTLELPVEGGTWYVAHGGPFAIVNHHNRVAGQRYGLDLTHLPTNGWIVREHGPVPSSYSSWDALVVAPVDGVVISL